MSAASLRPSAIPSDRVSVPRLGRRLRFGALAALVALGLATGCHRAPPPKANKAVQVFVTQPITDTPVTDYQDFTGRVDAIKTVDVRPRVSGYITEAPFKEGDTVKEGQLLFQIDDRPYKYQLEVAKAQLTAAQAQVGVSTASLEMARTTLSRARQAGRAATALELETNEAQQQSAEAGLNLARANVGTAQANLRTAQLNYEWCRVTSPISGRISRRNVDPGNLVKADDTALTTVVSENPMYTYFDVDERTYEDLRGSAERGQASWFLGLKFPVLMRLANQEDYSYVGTVNFLDNRLNGNSGTIRMRGEFKNDDGSLKAGMFARVRLPIGSPYKPVLIPDEAVQFDQSRKVVYVVSHVRRKNEKTGAEEEVDVVEYRAVQVGQPVKGLRPPRKGEKEAPAPGDKAPAEEPVTLRVIKEGLVGTERVIVVGMQSVRPGMAVEARAEAPPRPVESPLTKLLTSMPGGKPAEKGAAQKSGVRAAGG